MQKEWKATAKDQNSLYLTLCMPDDVSSYYGPNLIFLLNFISSTTENRVKLYA